MNVRKFDNNTFLSEERLRNKSYTLHKFDNWLRPLGRIVLIHLIEAIWKIKICIFPNTFTDALRLGDLKTILSNPQKIESISLPSLNLSPLQASKLNTYYLQQHYIYRKIMVLYTRGKRLVTCNIVKDEIFCFFPFLQELNDVPSMPVLENPENQTKW